MSRRPPPAPRSPADDDEPTLGDRTPTGRRRSETTNSRTAAAALAAQLYGLGDAEREADGDGEGAGDTESGAGSDPEASGVQEGEEQTLMLPSPAPSPAAARRGRGKARASRTQTAAVTAPGGEPSATGAPEGGSSAPGMALARIVQSAELQKLPLERLRASFKAEALPVLRQALDLAGGDGVDAYVRKLVASPGRPAQSRFLGELSAHLDRIHRAATREAFLAELRKLLAAVRRQLEAPSLAKLSLRVLEQEFEGRLEVDTLLGILFCADAELSRRALDVDRLLENLRGQLRSFPGAFPESLFWNFSRLKVEKRVIEAELRRRKNRKSSKAQ